MGKINNFFVLIISLCAFSLGLFQTSVGAKEGSVVVDIPVKVRSADVVFNVGSTDKTGEAPIGLIPMEVLAKLHKKHGIKGELVAVFHEEAGRFLLTDEAYNKHCRVRTGNPAKALILKLMKLDLECELCSMEMERFSWTHESLLPGVKSTTQGLLRIIELEQQGYTHIIP